jgi:hypothetical protein
LQRERNLKEQTNLKRGANAVELHRSMNVTHLRVEQSLEAEALIPWPPGDR